MSRGGVATAEKSLRSLALLEKKREKEGFTFSRKNRERRSSFYCSMRRNDEYSLECLGFLMEATLATTRIRC